jgi:hypothetical protein
MNQGLKRWKVVGAVGFELEAFTRRLSRVPKSRAKPRDLKRVVGAVGFELTVKRTFNNMQVGG